MEANKENGIFINGKAQIIDMLKYMNPEERSTLLKNIKLRNPALAKELYAESITFETIYSLDDVDLLQLTHFVKPAIMGVALKGANTKFQRAFLASAPRQYAEEAYSYLVKNIENETRDVSRAQTRVRDTIIALNNRGRITL